MPRLARRTWTVFTLALFAAIVMPATSNVSAISASRAFDLAIPKGFACIKAAKKCEGLSLAIYAVNSGGKYVGAWEDDEVACNNKCKMLTAGKGFCCGSKNFDIQGEGSCQPNEYFVSITDDEFAAGGPAGGYGKACSGMRYCCGGNGKGETLLWDAGALLSKNGTVRCIDDTDGSRKRSTPFVLPNDDGTWSVLNNEAMCADYGACCDAAGNVSVTTDKDDHGTTREACRKGNPAGKFLLASDALPSGKGQVDNDGNDNIDEAEATRACAETKPVSSEKGLCCFANFEDVEKKLFAGKDMRYLEAVEPAEFASELVSAMASGLRGTAAQTKQACESVTPHGYSSFFFPFDDIKKDFPTYDLNGNGTLEADEGNFMCKDTFNEDPFEGIDTDFAPGICCDPDGKDAIATKIFPSDILKAKFFCSLISRFSKNSQFIHHTDSRYISADEDGNGVVDSDEAYGACFEEHVVADKRRTELWCCIPPQQPVQQNKGGSPFGTGLHFDDGNQKPMGPQTPRNFQQNRTRPNQGNGQGPDVEQDTNLPSSLLRAQFSTDEFPQIDVDFSQVPDDQGSENPFSPFPTDEQESGYDEGGYCVIADGFDPDPDVGAQGTCPVGTLAVVGSYNTCAIVCQQVEELYPGSGLGGGSGGGGAGISGAGTVGGEGAMGTMAGGIGGNQGGGGGGAQRTGGGGGIGTTGGGGGGITGGFSLGYCDQLSLSISLGCSMQVGVVGLVYTSVTGQWTCGTQASSQETVDLQTEYAINCESSSASSSEESSSTSVAVILDKSGPGSVRGGDTAEFTFVIRNDGSALSDVFLVDIFADPSNAAPVTPDFVEADSADCERSSTGATCSLGTLEAGETRTVKIRYTMSTALCSASISNTASVRLLTKDGTTLASDTDNTTIVCDSSSSSSSSACPSGTTCTTQTLCYASGGTCKATCALTSVSSSSYTTSSSTYCTEAEEEIEEAIIRFYEAILDDDSIEGAEYSIRWSVVWGDDRFLSYDVLSMALQNIIDVEDIPDERREEWQALLDNEETDVNDLRNAIVTFLDEHDLDLLPDSTWYVVTHNGDAATYIANAVLYWRLYEQNSAREALQDIWWELVPSGGLPDESIEYLLDHFYDLMQANYGQHPRYDEEGVENYLRRLLEEWEVRADLEPQWLTSWQARNYGGFSICGSSSSTSKSSSSYSSSYSSSSLSTSRSSSSSSVDEGCCCDVPASISSSSYPSTSLSSSSYPSTSSSYPSTSLSSYPNTSSYSSSSATTDFNPFTSQLTGNAGGMAIGDVAGVLALMGMSGLGIGFMEWRNRDRGAMRRRTAKRRPTKRRR